MASKNLIVVVMLLSVLLGVDAKRSARKTEKLYRKAGKWQRKLRGVWELLGVKPFLVQPGEEGDECALKSKGEEDYVLKGADVFTQAQLDEAVAAAKSDGDEAFTIADVDVDMMTAALAAKDEEIAALEKSLEKALAEKGQAQATLTAACTACTACSGGACYLQACEEEYSMGMF